MGKQRKKKPISPSRTERAEGFTGFLLVLKRRPTLQNLTGLPQKTAPDRDEKNTEVRHYQKQK